MAGEVGVVPGPPRAPPPPLEEEPPSDEKNDPQPDRDAEGREHQLTDVKTVEGHGHRAPAAARPLQEIAEAYGAGIW
eukprot:5566144-Pyramimonas_sp.AAC.1